MPLTDLDDKENHVVFECLKAAVEGPFFPEWEFQTLFGLDREQIRRILSTWPDVDETDNTVHLALNNAMNNLLGYPHGCEATWEQYISVAPEELGRIFQKWRGATAGKYFDGML